MAFHSFVDRYRRVEYTGENRCLPCTVTNTLIAILGGLLVGVGVFAVNQSVPIAVVAGGLAMLAGLVQIWLRGYLVPGTPTLTKRYFPPWLLELFGKESVPKDDPTQDEDQQLNVERPLMEVGALQFDETGEDFELTESFARVWRDAIEDVQSEDDLPTRIESAFGVDGSVTIENGDQATLVRLDQQMIGSWESRAAMIADVASWDVLADRHEGWEDLSPGERAQLAGGLRLYIDQCPVCDGPTSFDTETTTSCCSEYEVATVSCEECSARLFEIPVERIADGSDT